MKKAFPGVIIEQRGDPAYNAPTEVYFGGMDLRDYFAAKAMQAIASNPHYDPGMGPLYQTGQELIAKWSYEQADQMLKAREKK